MKKLLILLLTLMMIFGVTAAVQAADDGLVFSEVGYKSQSDAVLESINQETAVKGYAKIVNTLSQNTGFSMMIAHYDSYDRLISVKAKNVKVPSYIDEATYSSPLLDVTGGAGSYFRLYITKDLTGLKPLADVPHLIKARPVADIQKISSADRDNVVENADGSITFTYWANDTDLSPKSVTFAKNVTVYLNGGILYDAYLYTTATVEALQDYYGYVSFAKSDATLQHYDTIYIEDYETIVVDDNNTSRYRITSKNNTRPIYYDPYDDTLEAVLYDENGEEMAWEDLVENDIVSIKRYENGDKTVFTGTNLTKTVTGVVTNILDEWGIRYIINGDEYGVDTNAVDTDEILIDDDGVFYLDIMGNITYFEMAESDMNYAFVAGVGYTGSLDKRTALKLYTSDGQYDTFYTASKVSLDGISGIDTDDLLDSVSIPMSMTEFDAYVRRNGLAEGTYWGGYDYGDLILPAVSAGQLISYKTNENGYVTSIDRPALEDTFTGATLKGKFTQRNADEMDLVYNEKTGSLDSMIGRLYVTDETVIMVANLRALLAPGETYDDLTEYDYYDLYEEDFGVFDTAMLKDEQIFEDAIAYNVDDNRNVGFILVKAEPDVPYGGGVLALVSGIGSDNNDAGDPIFNIKVLQDGEVTVLATYDDSLEGYVEAYQTILPTFNAAGEVKKADVLAGVGSGEVYWQTMPVKAKTDFIYGKVTEIGKKSITIDNLAYDGYSRITDVAVESSTYVYVYDDGLEAEDRVRVDDIYYIDYDKYEGGFFVGRDEVDVYALASEYDGDVTEIVLYIFRK